MLQLGYDPRVVLTSSIFKETKPNSPATIRQEIRQDFITRTDPGLCCFYNSDKKKLQPLNQVAMESG